MGCHWNRLNEPVFVTAIIIKLTVLSYFEKNYAVLCIDDGNKLGILLKNILLESISIVSLGLRNEI